MQYTHPSSGTRVIDSGISPCMSCRRIFLDIVLKLITSTIALSSSHRYRLFAIGSTLKKNREY